MHYEKRIFEKEKIYHVYNRGNNKQTIFYDKQDYNYYLKRLFEYAGQTNFSVLCFCLMKNHVHICTQQKDQTGLSKLLHKLHTSYSMYFNHKYQQAGHVFQGRFQYKYVESDYYLAYLSFYIHLNPWKVGNDYPERYLYSSLYDYYRGYSDNCDLSPILSQFNHSVSDYVNSLEHFKSDPNMLKSADLLLSK